MKDFIEVEIANQKHLIPTRQILFIRETDNRDSCEIHLRELEQPLTPNISYLSVRNLIGYSSSDTELDG